MPSAAIQQFFGQFSYLQLFFAFVVLQLVYTALSRLVFHPLRSFPGPRLAALTNKYQAYYEILQDGGFVAHLKELHAIYGPVVRVRPNELHFSTPEAYFGIYPSYSKFTKEPSFYKCFQEDESSFGFIDKQEHKQRREILNPLFSRRAILKVESLVQEKIDILIEKLTEEYKDKPANISHGLRAVTMDIVTAYCYSHSFEGLEAPDFNHPIMISIESAMPIMTATKHFPVLLYMNYLPDWLVGLLNPDIVGVINLKKFLAKQIRDILANPSMLGQMNHETVYHHLMTPEMLKSQQVPSPKSLMEEALAFLLAGTDTTSNAMIIGFFHVLNNPEVSKKLNAELLEAWPDKDVLLTYETLEKLPYLTAVIKESLRLSMGVTTPLPRVNENTVVIDGITVPPKTIVSSGVSFVLLDDELFPEPTVFKPERWMQEDSKSLDKYLVVFSKGPRSCVAINLAWCELYLTFGHIFRKLEMSLFETTAEDVDFRYHTVPVFRGRPLKAVVKARNA